MEYVKDLIIVCTVGAIAAAFAPVRFGRGVKTLTAILVVLTAVSPLVGFAARVDRSFGSGNELSAPTPDGVTYDAAVLEQTASAVVSYVRDVLDEKYGVRYDRINVIFDDAPDSVTLTEIQIFCGIRFDSYRDREIEDELSRTLGCDVFVYSE